MNLKKLIVRSVVLGCIMAVGATVTAFAYTRGLLNDNKVNVREASNTDSKVLGRLNKGDYVDVLDKEGSWYNISYADMDSVFIHSDYVEIVEADAYITQDDINFRAEANDASEILDVLNEDDKITVFSKEGNWFYADYEGQKGYVFADFVEGKLIDEVTNTAADGDKYAVIIAETGLNLRDYPSLQGNVIDILPLGTTADVIEEYGEWVFVKAPDGIEGYVNSEFLMIRAGNKEEMAGLGKEIIEFAEQYVGTPYVWGGTNLNSGVDCSGFVYAVFQHFGVSLSRSSAVMAAADGVSIDKSELQAGDLVFFDNEGDGRIDHVGIYMHDGYYIHSSSGKTKGVIISNLFDSYSMKTYDCAKRVLG